MLSVAAAIVSIIQLTTNVATLLKDLRDVSSPKIQLIAAKLITQRTIIKTWGMRLRAGGWNVPPESMIEVQQLFDNMTMYLQRAEEKMERILRAPDGKMTSRVFRQRFLFMNGGFDDLKDLTDVMEAMNEALKVIALQPPSYYSTNAQQDSEIARDTPRHQSRHEHPGGASCIVTDEDLTSISPTNTATIPISEIYKKCSQTLDILSWEAVEHPQLGPLSKLLKQWGDCLFEGPASLDSILDAKRGGNEVIVRVLTYIAVIEEILLRSICARGGERESRLKQNQVAISALLGSEPMSEFSLEIWAELQLFSSEIPSEKSGMQTIDMHDDSVNRAEQVESHYGGFESDAIVLDARAGLLNHGNANLENLEIASRDLERIVQLLLSREDDSAENISDSTLENNETNIFDQLSRTIGLLFDFSPAIRAFRRARFLDFDAEMIETDSQVIDLAVSEAEIAQAPDFSVNEVSERLLASHIETSLDLASGLEQILRNDESWAKKNGQKVKLYAPIMQKERERLEEFRRAKLGGVSPGEVKKLLDTVGGLERALSETLRDVGVKETGMGKTGIVPQIDIKLSGRETDEKLSELVDVFRDSNTTLWS